MGMALSTDIVLDIVLRHLTVRYVLRCRLVSKFWNKVASSVLRRRSTMIYNISDENHLMKLQECMEKSSDFPFAGLTFDRPWSLNSRAAMEFFQNHGKRFTRLCLETQWDCRLLVLAPFINHLSRLSILETGRNGSYPTRLVPLNSAAGQDVGEILKLPSVRTISILPFPEIDEDVLREVLLAASPSVQIECLDATPAILRALLNAGKLRAVSSIRFDTDEDGQDYKLKESQLFSIESPLLTKLEFNVGGCLSLDGLMKILSASQHTLLELSLNGMRMDEYTWEKFPVFTKMTTLKLCIEIHYHCRCLFQGRHGPKFPVLKELQLEMAYDRRNIRRTYLSDGLFIVPSLSRIDLEGYVSKDRIKELAQTFPNVVEIGLEYGYYSGDGRDETYGSNPFEIWSVREFQHLEKLRIWNFGVQRPTKNYVNMDSFLTGIPIGICQNLRKKQHLMPNLINSPFGEAFNDVMRVNPNILQLKNLKELVVCVGCGFGREELPEDPPFMSMVSMWYALEMMPNLRAKFVHNGPSRYPRLEAAFKDVQEYIKLERCF